MDSPPNPTAANRSQPPQQPKIQMDSSQNPTAANCSQPPQQSNGSSRICYQTPTPQTVHNLPSCPRYSRILHQNLPLQAVHNPHIFPESSRIVNHTLPRQAVHNRLKQNLILQAAFNLHRSLKLRQQYIHPTVQAVKVVRSSLNQQCLGILVKLIEESSVPAIV